ETRRRNARAKEVGRINPELHIASVELVRSDDAIGRSESQPGGPGGAYGCRAAAQANGVVAQSVGGDKHARGKVRRSGVLEMGEIDGAITAGIDEVEGGEKLLAGSH